MNSLTQINISCNTKLDRKQWQNHYFGLRQDVRLAQGLHELGNVTMMGTIKGHRVLLIKEKLKWVSVLEFGHSNLKKSLYYVNFLVYVFVYITVYYNKSLYTTTKSLPQIPICN